MLQNLWSPHSRCSSCNMTPPYIKLNSHRLPLSKITRFYTQPNSRDRGIHSSPNVDWSLHKNLNYSVLKAGVMFSSIGGAEGRSLVWLAFLNSLSVKVRDEWMVSNLLINRSKIETDAVMGLLRPSWVRPYSSAKPPNKGTLANKKELVAKPITADPAMLASVLFCDKVQVNVGRGWFKTSRCFARQQEILFCKIVIKIRILLISIASSI